MAEVKKTLPPVSISTWLAPHKSYNCEHNILYLRSDLQYETGKLDNANDFNLTFERFNNYRERYLVVSQRARQVLRKHGIHLYYYPVTLLDDTLQVTYLSK